MDSINAASRDGRSSTGRRSNAEHPSNKLHYELQRGLVLALAQSIRKFDKCRRFSPTWREAMRTLEERNPREYRNALYFKEQLLTEFIKQLRHASKNATELARIFPLDAGSGRSFPSLEEGLRHLACCSEEERSEVDPAWNAVYEQILLGPVKPSQVRPIARSFDELLQFRGLNLRGELTPFLQIEFPVQFADIVNDWRNRQICIADLKLLLERTSDKVVELTQKYQSLYQA